MLGANGFSDHDWRRAEFGRGGFEEEERTARERSCGEGDERWLGRRVSAVTRVKKRGKVVLNATCYLLG